MKKIAVDFGSGVTKIFLSGCGVVLREATCIAVEEYEEKGEKKLGIKACGDKARALYGRAAVDTRIVNPVFEGDIIHFELAVQLFKYFLSKIEITRFSARRTEILFILPCGMKKEVKQKYRSLAEACGFSSVYFTLTPFAAVIGQNVIINESAPMFSLDIGYSLSVIAAFSQDGIISGLSVNLGGGNIDVHIMDDLAENSNLKIGGLTAEKLKNRVASLLPDDNKMAVAEGRDLTSGAPVSVSVNSEQLTEAVTTYVDKILEYVVFVITKLPPEAASAVMRGGVYLSGGLIKMDGIADYIQSKLGMSVILAEEPQLAAVSGGGAIVSDYTLADTFATEE